MKKIMISLTTLFFLAFSTHADDHNTLEMVSVPSDVSSAVDFIYDLGRYEVDSGGISSIDQYTNPHNLSTFQIVKEIMFNSDLQSYAYDVAYNTCTFISKNDCIRYVLERNDVVQAGFQFSTITEFTSMLMEWELYESHDYWISSLELIDDYIEEVLGDDYKVYPFGYDYIADVYAYIMISKDKKNILVFTADYGA